MYVVHERTRVTMLFAEAFERNWFFVVALALGALYGFGGAVHIGNILGFGEMKWTDSPFAWRIGDIWWGALDVVALVGVILKSPIGLLAIALAAGSQIVVYSIVPGAFAVTEAHYSTLRGMVIFNSIVLIVLAVTLYVAIRSNSA